jgi:DNA-binding transcriptional LysR family regulator
LRNYCPPIHALRAFEAAARHQNYSRAAEELSLTHGAISHHVARLERDLGGVRLFARDGQRMLLTDAGQVLVLDVRRALRLLSEAFEGARAKSPARHDARTLTISVLPSFAARWLAPRLPAFQMLDPDLSISVRSTAALATMDARDGVDLAIRYGPGGWPGLTSIRLLEGSLFPVCSPAYRERRAIERPADLLGLRLLRCPRQKWTAWFMAAGLEVAEPQLGPSYDDAGLLIQAAIDDQGVALARAALVVDDLASGRLVRLFNIEIIDEYEWRLVWREPIRCDPQAHARFRDWLVQLAKEQTRPFKA